MNNNNEMNIQEPTNQKLTAGEVLHQGLEDSMFKLLNFQAQQGADQNSTMIMLALMNLLGLVNCMNRVLPEEQRVRGTTDLASQIAGMLGGEAPSITNSQGVPGQPQPGGIDPGMIAALASMLGGTPNTSERAGEAGGRSGLDPAMMAALAGMLSGPGGGGGANPAALMAMLANMLGPKRPPEGPKSTEQPVKADKVEKKEEKPKQTREQGPAPRGMLKWDSRFGSPSSSF